MGQISVPLGEIEPVADDVAVRDLEPDVADRDIGLAAAVLHEQRAGLDRRGLPRAEAAHEIGERQAGVDDVLQHEDVAVLDVDVEVLEDPDDPGGVASRAVARDRHEVDLARERDMAHEVGHEEDRALEDSDEQEVLALVVRGDLLTELGDPSLKSLLVDEDLLDRVRLQLTQSRLHDTPSASTIPGTATTSSPRTTSGHASRSDLGIFASTNTSWIFFLRPASRSPGRHPRTISPFSSAEMRHGPQRTSPSSLRGVRSIQMVSYSRTAVRPPPRSTRAEPTGASSSAERSGGAVSSCARRARLASASG